MQYWKEAWLSPTFLWKITSVYPMPKKTALSKAFREYEQPLPLNISWSIHSNKNLHKRKTKWKRGRSVMSYLESFSSGGGDGGAVKLIVAIVISTLRTLPKKSVMSTLPGSLWNRSVRWPGVDTHWLLGHTLNCNTNTRKEQKNKKSRLMEKWISARGHENSL